MEAIGEHYGNQWFVWALPRPSIPINLLKEGACPEMVET
jgi:hypothetical protein